MHVILSDKTENFFDNSGKTIPGVFMIMITTTHSIHQFFFCLISVIPYS